MECIIGYTDNTLVVTVEDDIPMLERKVNMALEAMTCWIESAGKPGSYRDRSGAVYMPSSVQSLLLLPKGVADNALYSPEVSEVVVQWKADFQGASQVDSSQSWKDCRQHKSKLG